MPEGSDILAFWKLNAASYPVLSAMTKDYLAVSVASSERAFSSGVDLVTRLTGTTIE